MKRELKLQKQRRSLTPGADADLVPMKRELKRWVEGFEVEMWRARCRPCPYEEGTETFSQSQFPSIVSADADLVPMKRELKLFDFLCGSSHLFDADLVPMKRELKLIRPP